MAEYNITPVAVHRKTATTATSVRAAVKATVTRLDTPEGEWERVGTGWGRAFSPKRAATRAIDAAHKIIERDIERRRVDLQQALDKRMTSR